MANPRSKPEAALRAGAPDFATVLSDLGARGLLSRVQTIICGDVRVDLAGDAKGATQESAEEAEARINKIMYAASAGR